MLPKTFSQALALVGARRVWPPSGHIETEALQGCARAAQLAVPPQARCACSTEGPSMACKAFGGNQNAKNSSDNAMYLGGGGG